MVDPAQLYSTDYKKKHPMWLNDKEFIDWMDCVEKIVLAEIGHYLLDLPDELYRVNFDNGTHFKVMAKTVITAYKKTYCH